MGGGIVNSLSLLELFGLLEEFSGVKIVYIKLALREGDQRVFVADIAKAKRFLDWEPLVGTRQGIAQMVRWTEGLE